MLHKRAREVHVGDRLLVMDPRTLDRHGSGSTQLVQAQVVAVNVSMRRGLYNPYTLSGTLVVEGVVVSAHSDWFADGVYDALGWSAWLPHAYQTVLGPVRVLWHILGQDSYVQLYNSLGVQFDFVALCSKGPWAMLALPYTLMRAITMLVLPTT